MRQLSEEDVREELSRLRGWEASGQQIEKEYRFRDFRESIAFVNRVAERAEAADHHPDLTIRWNRVRVTLSTHSVGGLTDKDVALAGEIENVAETPS